MPPVIPHPAAPSASRAPETTSSLWANRPLRRGAVIVLHVGLWALAFFFALNLRFGFEHAIPPEILRASRDVAAALVLIRVVSFFGFGLFDGIWRYAGFPEL